jgi:hypothetical protein
VSAELFFFKLSARRHLLICKNDKATDFKNFSGAKKISGASKTPYLKLPHSRFYWQVPFSQLEMVLENLSK